MNRYPFIHSLLNLFFAVFFSLILYSFYKNYGEAFVSSPILIFLSLFFVHNFLPLFFKVAHNLINVFFAKQIQFCIFF